jgi:hypothetical protein
MTRWSEWRVTLPHWRWRSGSKEEEQEGAKCEGKCAIKREEAQKWDLIDEK